GPDHRRRREAVRIHDRAADRRRDRELVRLHAGASFPRFPAAGPVRRKDHREGLMFYREAGDFKTSYRADSATFPIAFERYGYYAIIATAFLVIPFFINDYWSKAIMLPFLVYAIAALGLNILTGYTGQLSLGTGG